jgi:SagB-type dehydrogenase family enzyme
MKISLSPFARLAEDPPGEFSFRVGRASVAIIDASPALLEAFRRLARGAVREEDLADTVAQSADFSELLKLGYYLRELTLQGWLCHEVQDASGAPFATCVPLNRDHRLKPAAAGEGARRQISRFAYTRRLGAQTILECPTTHAHIVLHGWRPMALLAGPFADPVPGVDSETAREFLDLLDRAGFADGIAEDANPALAQWEFHDLVFHSRSREGRHANPYGGKHLFRGVAERPPVVKAPMSRDFVDLPPAELPERDLTLTAALESRHSERRHGPAAVSLRDLGEFLYRSARVTSLREDGVSRRVYPGGGACYELELYLAVNQCQGLDSGFYQYLPLDHRLCRISGRTENVEWLLENAGFTASSAPPQVLIEIAARFQRVSWKYASVTYATILKDVGALFQTMYLVAAAMDLSACALGGGHSDMFVRAAGTNYFEETSVGEFILGRAGG